MQKTVKTRIFKLVFLSFFLGILYNVTAPNGLTLIREKTILLSASDSLLNELTTMNSSNTLLNVTLSQANELHTNKTAVFIDARDQWDFADGHIAGSINIPEFSFEPDDKFVNSLDKDQFYLIYCGSDDCEISERLAFELQKIGFTKLAVFKDGWESWLNNGYPVEGENLE